jgi:hypothetical protein
MTAEFNPYSQWLKIPPSEQPPNYYRLLSLAEFESDSRMIESSVSRLVAKLQDLSTGENVEQAQRLLNDVATARLCLIDQIQKAKYDQRLKEQLDPVNPASAERSAIVDKGGEHFTKEKNSNPQSRTSHANPSSNSNRKPRKKNVVKPVISVAWVVGLGVAAFAVTGLAVLMMLRPAGDATAISTVGLSERSNDPDEDQLQDRGMLVIEEVESATAPPSPSVDSTPDVSPVVQVPPMVFAGGMQPDQLDAFQSMAGEVVHVEGVVVSIGRSKSGKTRYFRFSEDWDATIRVAMLEHEFTKEWMDANLEDYVGKRIHVSGVIRAQPSIHQKVELSIHDVSEIEIVE